MTPEQQNALNDFAAAVKEHYGDRVEGIYLFGSRARGDHRDESDADIAVILEDGAWIAWKEMHFLSDLSFNALLDTGLDIQPWPIPRSSWQDPSVHARPTFIRNARRDARALGVPA